eukprot:TCALIF_10252-PB protein Name:"Protein of unknown function" AED:0.47 eAED:1.00 QI:0/0/0/1/0/0/2/0/63
MRNFFVRPLQPQFRAGTRKIIKQKKQPINYPHTDFYYNYYYYRLLQPVLPRVLDANLFTLSPL